MKLHKKAEFDLQSFLITFLIFVGVLVTLGTVANEVIGNYNPITGDTGDPEFIATYDKLDSIEAQTDELKNKVVDTDTGTADASTDFLGDAVSSLKLVGTSLSSTTIMIDGFARTIGIEPYWFRILSMVLIIMLFTVILFMIFRYR